MWVHLYEISRTGRYREIESRCWLPDGNDCPVGVEFPVGEVRVFWVDTKIWFLFLKITFLLKQYASV